MTLNARITAFNHLNYNSLTVLFFYNHEVGSQNLLKVRRDEKREMGSSSFSLEFAFHISRERLKFKLTCIFIFSFLSSEETRPHS